MKYSELFKLLKQDGWVFVRQSDSNVIMSYLIKAQQLSVPNHGSREIKKGLCIALLKQAEIKTNKR